MSGEGSPTIRRAGIEEKRGHLAEWPNDKSSRKATNRILHQVFEASVVERVRKEASPLHSTPRLNILAPRLPALSNHPKRKKRRERDSCNTRGTLLEDLKRDGADWVSTGKSLWRGNKQLHLGLPTASRFPPNWEINESGSSGKHRTDGKLRMRDATEDERRFQCQVASGFSAEEDEFGTQRLGFPTERRPRSYRRKMKINCDDTDDAWISTFPKLIGELAQTPEQIHKARLLIATWRDLFVENIRDMPKTDLIEHRIPMYNDAVPNVAKPVLYTSEEVTWQQTNLPKLIEAGIITQCVSPWSARSRFPRKENGTLRMVHAFMQLNKATIKANYPMKRIEPILRKIAAPWLTHFFKTDASNGYWAVGVFPPHAYRLAFSSAMGQMCYLRMGQGCTGGPGTYTQLKDIVTSAIPSPDHEPALTDAMPERIVFDHFVDDDIGGADSFDHLVEFLHEHYFPRLAWAKLTLNPAKCSFFVPRVKILGHQRDKEGIRPSDDKLGQFRDWPIPTNKDELMRFLNTLPFLKAFIPGRADYTTIMKTAIVEESVVVKRGGKQQTTRSTLDFVWSKKHQDAFDAVKRAVLENVNSGGDDNRQYHLCTDASKTGAGGLLFQLQDSEVGIPVTKDLWEKMSPVMFMSYQFTPTQTRYHTTERECLAVVKSLAEVRWIVKGSKFPVILYTDHQALLKVLKSEDVTGRISRWQLALSEYDLDVYHVPGKDLAIADGLSRIEGYPSRMATDEESTMASFVAEGETEHQATAGRHIGPSGETRSDENLETAHMQDAQCPSARSDNQDNEDLGGESRAAWEMKWEEWLDDPWYMQVVEYHKTGVSKTESILAETEHKITKRKAKRFILIEHDDDTCELAYRESSGKLSRCIHQGQVFGTMEILHNLHGHFSDQITLKRCVGKFYWPTRYKDIYAFCRSCPNCQMIGPLRPTKGLLPVVSLQVGDILAFDYIGPFTPIAKSGARFIGIGVDYFARFLFADAVEQATSANTVAIFENKVVDKIGYPRAVYTDNGSHFKKHFAAHLKEAGVKQYFAPITNPSSVGLAERYVQLILNIYRAVLQHHPELIFEWDVILPSIVRAANTRYIRMFGFSPAELLMGFNPRYTKGADEFEDILRSKVVGDSIDALMSEEGMSVEEAAYESRLAIIDELRERSLAKRFQLGESTAESTDAKIHNNPEKMIKKGSLVRLRRLAQDNQKSHKMEPRWEGPYVVHKMAEHGRSAWISDLHSGKVKGRYHLNALNVFLQGKDIGRSDSEWKSLAKANEQTQISVKRYMEQRARQRKAEMNAKGKDSSEYTDPSFDIVDPKFARQHMGFPDSYGDEYEYQFWKHKAVDLNGLLFGPSAGSSDDPKDRMPSLGSILNPS